MEQQVIGSRTCTKSKLSCDWLKFIVVVSVVDWTHPSNYPRLANFWMYFHWWPLIVKMSEWCLFLLILQAQKPTSMPHISSIIFEEFCQEFKLKSISFNWKIMKLLKPGCLRKPRALRWARLHLGSCRATSGFEDYATQVFLVDYFLINLLSTFDYFKLRSIASKWF